MTIALQPDQEMAAHWKTQIEQCDKSTEKWRKRAEKISKHYRDEREDSDKGIAKRLNLFWSNVETLKPVIYSKTPVPICERRFLDKDISGRAASTILERVLRYEVAMSGFDPTMRRCRNDYLIPGRGQSWVRYDPKFGEPISPEQTAEDDISAKDNGTEIVDEARDDEVASEEREFLSESLAVDYVHWQDFFTFPANARTWTEVEGVGRRLFMSRNDMKDADFKDWKTIPLDHVPKMEGNQGGGSTVSGQEGVQATVYEIWWKPERRVYFIAKSYDKVCKEADDPLKLEGFFPCPEPLSATMTNDSMIPVPDYAESQDQYTQIDDLTKRIDILTASTKVIGVYDAAAQSLKRVFEEASEPNLIPVDSWAMFAEKGGIKGAIDWVPIEAIAKTLNILIEVRTKIIEDLDRTTGISDIMRGTSDARETMGGQRLKSNNSSTRVRERQDDMARFARDVISIMAEIVSEHYSPETLIQISGAMNDEGLDPPSLPSPPLQPSAQPLPPAQMPPQAGPPGHMQTAAPAGPPLETPEQKQARKLELISQAIMLLRQDKLRGFRIDIETDSTVQGDAEQEKAQRIEFLTATTKFIETAAQVTGLVPEFAPLAAKMLGFGVRGFRVGRDLESAIDDFCDKAEQDAKERAANPQQKPDPETIKAQTEQMKAQAEIDRQRVENEGEAANSAANLRMKEIDMQMEQMRLRMAEIKLEETRLQVMGKAHEASEGEAGSTKGFGIHPVIAGEHIVKAAQAIDLASRRNAAPKRIIRGPDGKASHVVTEFAE
jgi:hypothetical protein